MCSQDSLLVNVVGIRPASSWVVDGEAERVEVLMHRYNGGELIVGLVDWLGKLGLDYSASNCEWVRRLKMKLARESRGYVNREVRPFVCVEFYIFEFK